MAKTTYPYHPSRLPAREEKSPQPGIVTLSVDNSEDEPEVVEPAPPSPLPEPPAPPSPVAARVIKSERQAPGTAIDHRPAQGERWRLPDGQVIVIEELMERHGGAVLRGLSDGEWHDLREALGPLPHQGAREDDPSSGGFLVG